MRGRRSYYDHKCCLGHLCPSPPPPLAPHVLSLMGVSAVAAPALTADAPPLIAVVPPVTADAPPLIAVMPPNSADYFL